MAPNSWYHASQNSWYHALGHDAFGLAFNPAVIAVMLTLATILAVVIYRARTARSRA